MPDNNPPETPDATGSTLPTFTISSEDTWNLFLDHHAVFATNEPSDQCGTVNSMDLLGYNPDIPVQHPDSPASLAYSRYFSGSDIGSVSDVSDICGAATPEHYFQEETALASDAGEVSSEVTTPTSSRQRKKRASAKENVKIDAWMQDKVKFKAVMDLLKAHDDTKSRHRFDHVSKSLNIPGSGNQLLQWCLDNKDRSGLHSRRRAAHVVEREQAFRSYVGAGRSKEDAMTRFKVSERGVRRMWDVSSLDFKLDNYSHYIANEKFNKYQKYQKAYEEREAAIKDSTEIESEVTD